MKWHDITRVWVCSAVVCAEKLCNRKQNYMTSCYMKWFHNLKWHYYLQMMSFFFCINFRMWCLILDLCVGAKKELWDLFISSCTPLFLPAHRKLTIGCSPYKRRLRIFSLIIQFSVFLRNTRQELNPQIIM